MAGSAKSLALQPVPVRDNGPRRNCFPRQPPAADNLVPSYVARHEPKDGISALGLQRVLGLGSYKTAWTTLHKLRRAMVRPDRDRLNGIVEVDETYWGGEESGAIGRGVEEKALIIVAAQEDGKGIGRIRLRRIPDLSRATLHGFIARTIEPGSTIRTTRAKLK